MSKNEGLFEIKPKEAANALHEVSSGFEGDSEQDSGREERNGRSNGPNDARDGGKGYQRSWRRSLIRFGPVSGVLSMLLAFTSIIACLGILAGSDNQKIESWTTPPSTYLALWTAVANGSMRYAAAQGLVVAWWMRATKGAELSVLHYDWRAGSSLLGALTAGRRMGLLGIACVFSTFVVIDGPLLQRASTVVRRTVNAEPILLNVTMAPELPRGFTGRWGTMAQWGTPGTLYSYSWNATVPTPHGTAPNNILPAIRHPWLQIESATLWPADLPLENVIYGCRGQCKAKIQTPALFATACTSHRIPHNYLETWGLANDTTEGGRPPLATFEYMVSTILVLDGTEKVAMTTGYTETQTPAAEHVKDCNTTFIYDTCILEAGIAEYEVIIDGDKILMSDLGTPTLVALSNNTQVDYSYDHAGYHPSTLAGVVAMVWDQWESNAFDWKDPDSSSTLDLRYKEAITEQYRDGLGVCSTFRNPREDVMASMNKLMLYMGALAGGRIADGHNLGRMDPEISVQTTASGYPFGKEDVFRTHYVFFAAAAAVEVVCILLVAPTYWGWWRFGRSMSLSPLEIAKAFKSPLLAQYKSNSTARELAVVGQGHYLKYGVIPATENGRAAKLAFEDPNYCQMAQPYVGQRFED